jgi:site-specific recombinase XerD
MAGRKPLLESELPLVTTALAEFCARDRALFILGLNTGFRISELLALNVGEVWDGERIRPQVKVTRAKLKGGRGLRRRGITSRTVPINEAATQALQRYLFTRLGAGELAASDPLFPSRFHGQRLTRWGANDIVHAVLAKAGIDGKADYGTHSLRKSFCRQIYKRTGNDLNLTRAVMGHASCATTQKYLHVDEEEIVDAIMGLGAGAGAGVGIGVGVVAEPGLVRFAQ